MFEKRREGKAWAKEDRWEKSERDRWQETGEKTSCAEEEKLWVGETQKKQIMLIQRITQGGEGKA